MLTIRQLLLYSMRNDWISFFAATIFLGVEHRSEEIQMSIYVLGDGWVNISLIPKVLSGPPLPDLSTSALTEILIQSIIYIVGLSGHTSFLVRLLLVRSSSIYFNHLTFMK